MAPKIGPKFVQKLIFSGSFLDPLFLRSWSSLGASWKPSWASGASLGRPLWTPKTLKKTNGLLRFLQMQDFGCLKLLVALLGPSSPLLGPIWSQNGPQNDPKSGPKNAQKFVQKIDPTITPKMPVLGPKMAPKLGSKIMRNIDPSLLGQSSATRCC